MSLVLQTVICRCMMSMVPFISTVLVISVNVVLSCCISLKFTPLLHCLLTVAPLHLQASTLLQASEFLRAVQPPESVPPLLTVSADFRSLVSAVHPPPSQLPPIQVGMGRGAAAAACWRPLAVNVMRLSTLPVDPYTGSANKNTCSDQCQHTEQGHGTRTGRRRALHWWTTGRGGTRCLAA